jgi:nucleoside-diphosphate-sugar epimerase
VALGPAARQRRAPRPVPLSRSNTFVADVVDATIAAISRGRAGATYNIGGGEEIALLDALDVLSDVLGVTPVVVHAEPRPGDQRRTHANIERARSDLGWEPRVSPIEGLAEQARWVASANGASGSTT